MAWAYLVLIAIVITPFAFRRELANWWRFRRLNRRSAEQISAWRVQFDAANPTVPPWSEDEIAAFRRWLDDQALPATVLTATDAPIGAAGTRIGGPLFVPAGERWPVDAQGSPLEFVAQLDFAELPPLPDFPASGVLQFFVGRDDLFGADFDNPAMGVARVHWLSDAPSEGTLVMPPPLGDADSTPFQVASGGKRKDIRREGMPLAGKAVLMKPGGSNWRVEARLEGQLRRTGIERVEALLDASDAEPPLAHHVGGFPVFTQTDFRKPDHYGNYDRVLLRLTSDEALQWGDMGEACFLIRQADLIARDFGRVAFYWDCS